MDPTVYYMKVFIFESLQESTLAVLRVFTPTANSPVVGGGGARCLHIYGCILRGRVHEGAWTCVLGCVHVPSGRATSLSGSRPPWQTHRGCSLLSTALQSLPRGRFQTPAASSVDTWPCKLLCLDPIFVIYIFRNSIWSGLSDLLHSEHCILR